MLILLLQEEGCERIDVWRRWRSRLQLPDQRRQLLGMLEAELEMMGMDNLMVAGQCLQVADDAKTKRNRKGACKVTIAAYGLKSKCDQHQGQRRRRLGIVETTDVWFHQPRVVVNHHGELHQNH